VKIRFRDDSIRVRLTQREVAELAASGRVQASTHFGGNARLRFEVRSREGAMRASFENSLVAIEAPASLIRDWAAAPQIALSGASVTEQGEFRISIEKDLECRKPRPYEDNSDAFPASLGQAHCA